MLVLKLVFLGIASAGISAALARVARRTRGAWPITLAVLRGRGPAARDLRFLAFVGGVIAVVTSALVFPGAARALGPIGVASSLVVLLPALTVGLAAGADAGRRGWRAARTLRLATPPAPAAPVPAPAPVLELPLGPSTPAIATIAELRPQAERAARAPQEEREPATVDDVITTAAPLATTSSPGEPAVVSTSTTRVLPRPSAHEDGALEQRLDIARAEVQGALVRLEDPSLRRAAGALEELLIECEASRGDPSRSGSMQGRRALIDGVATLARALTDDEQREAAHLLGVTLDASADEVAAVHRALVRIYRGPDALPGVDPARADALADAARLLEAARPVATRRAA